MGFNMQRMNKPSGYFYGQLKHTETSNVPSLLAVYWTGMTANQNWLRVDVERHVEALPRRGIKDIVAVERPETNDRTIEFVKQFSHQSNLHGHSLREGDMLTTYVKPILHRANEVPAIVTQDPTSVAMGLSNLTGT
jgi:hypothetical protein